MKRRVLFTKILLGLSLLGMALATYSLAHKTGFTSGALCDINSTFNCDVVNRGPYSEIASVPVALLGLIAYAFFALAAFMKLREPHDRNLSLFLFVGTGSGFLFSLYLSSIEAFILHTWCIVCLTSQFTTIAMFALACAIFFTERTAPKLEQAEEIVKDAVHDLNELR